MNIITEGIGPESNIPFFLTGGLGPFVEEEEPEVDLGWTPIQTADSTWTRVSP
jgi:hypothetical protein